MLEIEQYKLTIKDLEKLQAYSSRGILIPESDYGLAEIYYKNGKFELFSIPMYGGEPSLEMVDSNAQIILTEVKGWC